MCYSKFERREDTRTEERVETPQEISEPWAPKPEPEAEELSPQVDEREEELVTT